MLHPVRASCSSQKSPDRWKFWTYRDGTQAGFLYYTWDRIGHNRWYTEGEKAMALAKWGRMMNGPYTMVINLYLIWLSKVSTLLDIAGCENNEEVCLHSLICPYLWSLEWAADQSSQTNLLAISDTCIGAGRSIKERREQSDAVHLTGKTHDHGDEPPQWPPEWSMWVI